MFYKAIPENQKQDKTKIPTELVLKNTPKTLFPVFLRIEKHDYKFLGGYILRTKIPGGPVVRNPHSHCRGSRFNPWPRN